MTRQLNLACAIACLGLTAFAAAQAQNWTLELAGTNGLTLRGMRATAVTHNGRAAVRLVPEPGFTGEGYATVSGPVMRNGTIDVDVPGRPGDGRF